MAASVSHAPAETEPNQSAALPPGNALSVRLLRAREAIMVHVRPILREHGLTEPQYRVLRALQFGGPLDSTTLAARAALLPPSVSRIVRDLRELGLLEEVAGPNGSRFPRPALSSKGRRAVERAAVQVDAVMQRIAARLGEVPRRELEQLLERLEEALIRL